MKNRNKGIALSYFYFVFSTIIGVFISSFIVRSVGKTEYGIYQSMTAFIAYLTLLEFGMGSIMSRNISLLKKDGTEDLKIQKNISTIWIITLALAFILVVVSVIFYFSIDNIFSKSMTIEQIHLGEKIFIFAATSLILTFLNQTLNGMIIGHEKYIFENIVSIIKLTVRTLIIVVTLTCYPNILFVAMIDALISILLFFTTLTYSLINIKVRLSLDYFDLEVLKFSLPLAAALLIQTIVNSANGSIDKFVISIMLKPEHVSVYSISMILFTMFSSLSTIPLTMYMPTVAKQVRAGAEGIDLTKNLVQPSRLNILISGLAAFGIVSLGKPFISIVYGDEYKEAWIYAIIVIIPMFFNMFNSIILNILDIKNKLVMRSVLLTITTMLNLVITIFGVKYIGMLGAALGTAISLVVQTIALNYYYNKKLGIKVIYLFRKSFKGLLLNLLIACATAELIVSKISNAFVQFFVGGVVFVSLFFMLFILFGKNKYEKDVILKIINIFKSKERNK